MDPGRLGRGQQSATEFVRVGAGDHHAQVELLKIDWGNPGFCTEWDRCLDRTTGRCADGRRPGRR